MTWWVPASLDIAISNTEKGMRSLRRELATVTLKLHGYYNLKAQLLDNPMCLRCEKTGLPLAKVASSDYGIGGACRDCIRDPMFMPDPSPIFEMPWLPESAEANVRVVGSADE